MGLDAAAVDAGALEDEEHSFRLDMVAEPRFVSTARLFAATLARQFACPEERVQDVKVAISEACSNAIKAHRQAGVSDPIQIFVHSDPKSLTYEIVDAGEGFEFEGAAPAPDDPENLVEGGIGLTLIGALFPGFEVRSGSHGDGTVLRFSVNLPD